MKSQFYCQTAPSTLVRSRFRRSCLGAALAVRWVTDGFLWSNRAALAPRRLARPWLACTNEPVCVSLDWKSCCSRTLSLAARGEEEEEKEWEESHGEEEQTALVETRGCVCACVCVRHERGRGGTSGGCKQRGSRGGGRERRRRDEVRLNVNNQPSPWVRGRRNNTTMSLFTKKSRKQHVRP